MKQLIITCLTLVSLCGCHGQTKTDNPSTIVTEIPGRTSSLTLEEIEKLDSVNIDFLLRSNCHAYSSNKNAKPSNGEGHSDNLPGIVDQSFPQKGLYLAINQSEFSKIDEKFLGCKLYLVNTTDSLVTLSASDSRLYIVAEALNKKNKWTRITYLPSSGCGNSYHTVALDKDEYWSFNIPVFKGKFKTKMRYVLLMGNERKLISNEIAAYLNKGQFDEKKKQGHSNSGIMDPYND